MSPAALRRVLAPAGLALVVGGLLATASPAGAVGVPQIGVSTAHQRWPGPVGTPSATSPVAGRLDLHWGWVSSATRYRLLWSAKPYGGFRDGYGAWLPSSARGASLRVSPTYSSDAGQRTIQTALPYGNPVYVRLQANNALIRNRVATHSSSWSRGYFPRIATPTRGDTLRVGTYNLGQSTNVSAVVSAIRSQKLHVLALQEVKAHTADQVARALGWRASPIMPGQQQQVIYDAAAYDDAGFHSVALHNYKGGPALRVPCQRLQPTAESSNGRAFWMCAPHLVVDPRAPLVTRNAQNSANAKTLAGALSRFTGSDPVVVAGDLTANREPYTTPTAANPGGGQQVLVSHGFWDTRAALHRYGVGYSTVNAKHYPQPASPVGVSSRADYILTKGIRGATTYANVANRRSPLSDHNLVWSQVQVPAR